MTTAPHPAATAVVAWSNDLLAARSLAALDAALDRGPSLADESLRGVLLLVDPRHELRLLAEGEVGDAWRHRGLRFVDGLASIAPSLTALHAPWTGTYHAADHGLVFDEEDASTHVTLLPLSGGVALQGVYAVGARGGMAAFAALDPVWLKHVASEASASAERLFQRARLLRAGAVDPFTGWNSRQYLQARMREQVAAALLPATPVAGAGAVAERVPAAMRVTAGPASVGPLRVSIGIAVLELVPGARTTDRKAVADAWLAQAYAALHLAKLSGGNRHAVSAAGAASAPGR